MAEQLDSAVRARELFYQGTIAYKTGEFSKAAEKYRDGLKEWKKAMNDYPTFRDDDLARKDTGLIVKRYARALQQAGEPMPDDTPFKDTLALAQADTTLDPFDQIEMIGVTAGSAGTQPPSGGAALPNAVPTTPGAAPGGR